jgi:hypothetical protein
MFFLERERSRVYRYRSKRAQRSLREISRLYEGRYLWCCRCRVSSHCRGKPPSDGHVHWSFTRLSRSSSSKHKVVLPGSSVIRVAVHANARFGLILFLNLWNSLNSLITHFFYVFKALKVYKPLLIHVTIALSSTRTDTSCAGAGAGPNAQAGDYGTALQICASQEGGVFTKILIEAGTFVNAEGEQHGSALHWTALAGHEQVVKLLLDAGADPNAGDK